MDLARTNPDFLGKLHQEAFAYYNQNLTQLDPDGVKYEMLDLSTRSDWTLEALFHAAQTEKYCVQETNLSRSAKEHLENLASKYWQIFTNSIAQMGNGANLDPLILKESWQKDQELRKAIGQLPNGTEIWIGMNQILTAHPLASRN
jgi:hypothetical protein